MASLNQIATSILNEVNQANNFELLERIKDRAKFLRATILKRNTDKYGVNDEVQLPFRFRLQKTSTTGLCNDKDSKCFVYETVNKIPMPIRGNNRPIFSYIGAIGGILPFYYTRYFNIPMLKQLSIHKKTVFATLTAGRITVINNSHIKYVEVYMMAADMDSFIDECNDICYTDDDEFLVPYDVIDSIITTLVGEFIRVNNPNSNYKINIDTIDKQTTE